MACANALLIYPIRKLSQITSKNMRKCTIKFSVVSLILVLCGNYFYYLCLPAHFSNVNSLAQFDFVQKEYVLNITGTSDWLEVFRQYSEMLDAFRSARLVEVLATTRERSSHFNAQLIGKREPLKLYHWNASAYFPQALRLPDVTTLSLHWPHWRVLYSNVNRHVMTFRWVTNYFDWSVMPRACELRSNRPVSSGGPTPCPERGSLNRSFELIGNLPTWQQHAHGEHRLLFVHVIRHALVDKYGFVRTKDVDLFLYPCYVETANRITIDSQSPPHYSEVYVIAVNYPVFFHATIESIPRMMPHLEFLKRNPHIKIHALMQGDAAVSLKNYFSVLGLDPARIISGLITATVVYLPNAGGCINTLQPNVQAFAYMAQQYALKTLLQPFGQRQYIVLLQRSKSRQFHQLDQIKSVLLTHARSNGLKLVVYSDLAPLPFSDVLLYFQNALLIVGAHGGGLANMVWTPPGACVLEVLCKYGIGPRLIFNNMAVAMGHHYHGILATSGSSYDLQIDMENFEKTVNEMLKLYYAHVET